ncbi:hypothetical protein EDD11_007673 [Mortierella claussenii]|nr:hypothetical protein EDD11_007673 [Mortierella claussenii]
MKFTLSLAVLAVVASQAMAVVPIPIKGCTKTVIVLPTDTGCADFAAKNGCTFQDLLKWNLKLSPLCNNLDVNAPICVSMTPGAGNVTAPVVPTSAPVVPTSAPVVPSTSAPVATGSAIRTSSVALPPSATSAAPSGTPGTSAPPTATKSPSVTNPNSANGNKASMVLGAAGALLSAVYLL